MSIRGGYDENMSIGSFDANIFTTSQPLTCNAIHNHHHHHQHHHHPHHPHHHHHHHHHHNHSKDMSIVCKPILNYSNGIDNMFMRTYDYMCEQF